MLDAVDRLRSAASEQHRISRMVRVGTVNAATVPLLIPVVREFRSAHPLTQVEVVAAQQTEIHRALSEGGFDLGLVNQLDGDDVPAGFDSTQLLCGRPVVCVRPDSPARLAPPFSYSTDGAEMARLMVAEGLGATVLPDFSAIGDPLERQGTITYRPVADDTTWVLLMLQRRRAESVPRAAQDLHEVFAHRARESGGTLT